MMSRTVKGICIVFLCWFAVSTGNAQRKPDADALFLQAREAAHADHWAEARRICRQLLSFFPNYFDASILVGRTYAWELKTDSARMAIVPLLNVEPDNYEVLGLLADNEMWGSQYDRALEFIDMALGFYPLDEDFLFRKANIYYLKKDNVATITVLHELLTVYPEHVQGNELINAILPPEKRINELYARAGEESNAGNWKLSRSFCRQILKDDPNHFAASLLMAQTFAYESKFDSARLITAKLYETNRRHYDLLALMVNTEIWNRRYKPALQEVETALAAYSNDESFLFKKASIQYQSKDYRGAMRTLDNLLAINPEHEDAIAMKKDIMDNHRFKDYAFIENYYEYFKEPYLSHKMITSTGLAKWTKYGTYIAKVNVGNEWGRDKIPYKLPAYQYEGEAYQQLFPTNYLYLNYAWSWYLFFPEHRGGAEFFQRLPKGFEVSLGARFLYWTDLRWFYTGSISWLHNKNYLAFRPFFCYQDGRWDDSYVLTYRRYFSEKEDYMFALAGYGNYSDDFQQLNPLQGSSYLAQIGILKFLTVRWFLLASIGYAYDAFDAYQNGFRNRYQAQAGVRYYFNMFN